MSTGGGSIRQQLANLDLRMIIDYSLVEWKESEEEESIGNEWEDRKVGRRKDFLLRRMELAKHFIRTNIEPKWMVLRLLPILPPELRPIYHIDEDKLVTSDINEIYRRIIYRNNTLTDLLTTSIATPEELIISQEKLLQEAVDALLDNGICGQPMRDDHNRIYKSLSDAFVIRDLIRKHLASNIGVAKSQIRKKKKKPIVWEILQVILDDHPVLLNRAPTLHRLGIQAFLPVLVEGRAICLHPLVCKGFNADFDGDQMAVHVPLSLETQAEARLLMFSHMNLLSPTIGDPISAPTQDMISGLYVLTSGNRRGICVNRYNPCNQPFFCNAYDAIGAYRQKRINLGSPLWLWWRLDQRVIAAREAPIEIHYESLGTYYEIYGHYLIVRSIKKEILYIYIRTTLGHISLYREIEEAIQGFWQGCYNSMLPARIRVSPG
ncbi:DNA-directed RNA polymerase subunit beta' [Helianthus anomalus]